MTNQPEVELYAFWRTSATYRVRVALNFKGIQANERFVDVDAGQHRSEQFLKINPMGAIPALVLAGHQPLTQSLAILEFLDEVQPQPPLLPTDPYERARVRSIAQMLAIDIHPLITTRIKKELKDVHGFDDAAWRTWQTKWFNEGLQAVEQRLNCESGTGQFCHGDGPTMADICLASLIAVMRVFKIEIAGTPTIDRIIANCDSLEVFAKADPMRQAGAPPL